MEKRLELGFVGAGNMAGAIMGGIAKAGEIPSARVGVYDISEEKRAECAAKGYTVFQDIPALVAGCRAVVLAVKPQSFPEVLPQVRRGMAEDTLLISIAAGISIAAIKAGVGFDCKVVQVMPNTPLMLGEGASALCREAPVTDEEFAFATGLFGLAGIAREVQPSQMHDIIPVNGSSPAFVYLFAATVADWAAQRGIDEQAAMELFCQTLTGSARMLRESGRSARELIDMVCSPGGTTLAAMDSLDKGGFTQVLRDALDACANRARELAGER